MSRAQAGLRGSSRVKGSPGKIQTGRRQQKLTRKGGSTGRGAKGRDMTANISTTFQYTGAG